MNKTRLQEITSDQFIDRVVITQSDALVKVSTTWSGAGQMLCQTLDELAEKYSGKMNFYFVDHSNSEEINIKYMVETVPTLLFFKKGMLVDKLAGLNHRNVIEEKINQIVNA